jgi:sugar phosphate isomerase/epimerase
MPKALEEIKKLGFEGVEIVLDRPFILPQEIERFDPEILKRIIPPLHVSCVNANSAWELADLSEPEEGLRRKRIKYTKTSISLAKEIGAENISVASGVGNPKVKGSKLLQIFVDSLEQILSFAERVGIKVGIEYEPDQLVNSLKILGKILRMFEHPLLGVNLDVGHALAIGENLYDTILILGDRIWNIHLEDTRKKEHLHLIPGEGSIDFKKLKKALERINYKGFLTLELYPYKDDPSGAGEKALRYLRSLGF